MIGETTIPSDETLVARVKFDDDLEAFNLLHERYRGKILNYLCRCVGNYQLAEELTQSTFIKFYQTIPTLGFIGNIHGLIYKIALNMARMELRKMKARPETVSEGNLFTKDGEEIDLLNFIPNHRKRPDRIARAKDLEMQIQRAIHSLPGGFREIFVLCAVEGISYEEASEILKIGKGTVCSRLFRARKMFAAAMGIRADKQLSEQLI